jgi:hypothetical protein
LAGSIPSAECVEYPEREIINAIVKSGIVPVDIDLYQLLKSIRTQYFNWAVDTGFVNSLACIFDPPLMAYRVGFVVRIKVRNNNTGASQIDCGPGARTITRLDGSPLHANDMVIGGIAVLRYDGASFQLANPNPAALLASAPHGLARDERAGGSNITYVINQYASYQAILAWTDAGTYDWVVPADVTRAWLRLWGGGGGGIIVGDNKKIGGPGGYVEDLADLVPGEPMRIVIGAGGLTSPKNQASQASAQRGGMSSFGSATGNPIYTATGGGEPYKTPSGAVPSNGDPGVGSGGAVNRANSVYGAGGGFNIDPPDAHHGSEDAPGDPGACIIMY